MKNIQSYWIGGLLILFFPLLLLAQTVDDEKVFPSELLKPASIFDRGIAYMDAGKLQVNGVENYGMIGYRGYPYCKHGFWGELRWIIPFLAVPPQPWATQIRTEDGNIVDRSSYYNVIESITMYFGVGAQGVTYSDWEAMDHSREWLMGTATDANGVPLIATSTQEDSWPEGYWDRNPNSETYGQFIPTPGERHWPGYWAIDPDPSSPTYGKQIPGEFVSDKDIFFIMTDKYNGIRKGDENNVGYPIGFDIEVSGYCYSTRAYEDIVFFNYNLIYNDRITDPSRQHYDGRIDSLYFGFFLDPDLPGRDPLGYTVDPWAEDDYCYADTVRNIFVMYDKDGWDRDADDINSEGPVSAYAVAFLKTPKNETGKEIGLTGFHWFAQEDFDSEPSGSKMEQILYAMASGRKDILDPQDQQKYFHGDDPNFDDLSLLRDFQEKDPPGSRIDVMFLMSSGPFSISPGDTIPLHFCIMAGNDNPGPLDADGFPTNPYEVRFADVIENYGRAMELYQNRFRGTGPPKRPTLYAVGTKTIDESGLEVVYSESGKVTLYWNDVAEKSVDLITKERDFEGYKIYKAVYNPRLDYVDWGVEIYEITPEGKRGDVLTYEPVFQSDKIDDWEGSDPLQPWFYLGNNSGIVHTWTDTDVQDGVRYRYAITAYDYPNLEYGFPANETPRGTTPRDINVIDVIPGTRPIGFVEARVDSTFERISGAGNGYLALEVTDDNEVNGHTYVLAFDDTSSGVLQYHVYDETEETYVLQNVTNITNESSGDTPEAFPIFDGIGIKVINFDKIEVLNQDWVVVKGDTSDYSFEITRYYQKENPADYEIRFLGPNADTSFVGNKTVPFQVWNVTTTPPKKVDLLITPRTGEFKSGDKIIFYEQVDPPPAKKIATWELVITFTDTSIAPSNGDVYKIIFKKPFTSRDKFRFRTYPPTIDVVEDSLLKKIRVVPNPYVVTANWETYTGSSQWVRRELRFIHLPPKCTIDIYTLTGDHIRRLEHDNPTFGEERWDLLTKENLEISYGVFLYVVKTPNGKTHAGKIAVIK